MPILYRDDAAPRVDVFLLDSSAVDGSWLEGVAYDTASLTIKKRAKSDAAWTTLDLEEQTAVGTWEAPTDDDTVMIKETSLPGSYELVMPAAWSAEEWVELELAGAADLAPTPVRIEFLDAHEDSDPVGVIDTGTAQAGSATTITLASSASAINNFYSRTRIRITGGTGAGQSRRCRSYVGSTKVATVRAWAVNPDATSTYAIIEDDEYVSDDVQAHDTSIDGQLDVAATERAALDSLLDAIKAVTDQFVIASGLVAANVEAINASLTAAARLEERMKLTWGGTLSGTPTATTMTITKSADSVDLPSSGSGLVGRYFMLKSGALNGRYAVIVSYTGTTSTGVLVLATGGLPSAPANTDTWEIT
jgi:hypothetical protein